MNNIIKQYIKESHKLFYKEIHSCLVEKKFVSFYDKSGKPLVEYCREAFWENFYRWNNGYYVKNIFETFKEKDFKHIQRSSLQ